MTLAPVPAMRLATPDYMLATLHQVGMAPSEAENLGLVRGD